MQRFTEQHKPKPKPKQGNNDMKLLNAKTLAAVALTGALSIGTASAMGLSTGTQPLNSVVGVNSASISYKVQDGVATLFGTTDSKSESQLAQYHIENIDGVDRVINLVTFN
jgi:hypothetical protein